MPLVPCPVCNHSVSDQAPFCPQCGHPLRPASTEPHPEPSASPAAVPAAAPEPAPVPETAPAPEPDPLRCVCGTWNRVGDARCASCRRPLGQHVTGRRPIQYVNTVPLTSSPVRDPRGERQAREDEAAETLGTIAVVCGITAFLVWPLFFGLIALAFGIPSYLRGSRRGRTGVIIAISAMSFWLLVGLLF